MARLSMRCPDEMVAAVDRARGDVPREVWLRRAVERALDAQPEFVPASTHNALAEAARQGFPVPDERLHELAREIERNNARARSLTSSQAKRDVRPIPKKGSK